MVGTHEDGERTNGEDEYVCDACGDVFPTEEELEDHMHEQGIVD